MAALDLGTRVPGLQALKFKSASSSSSQKFLKPVRCTQIDQNKQVIDCCCDGRSWVMCNLCNGEKMNVRGDNNRIYRRCPDCKATGWVMCSRCKVYRCVTFPGLDDEL